MSTVFEAALLLPAESREAYVDRACLAHPEFRAELMALLAAADGAPAYLSAFARDVVAPGYTAARAADGKAEPELEGLVTGADAATGTRIRHYLVGARLGQGGMGVVYRGRDTRLGRDVALKFLSPSRVSDDSARRQIVREAQAVSTLDDPNVCALHAVEDSDDGGICLVMAYCVGGTLRDRLRQSLIPVATALDIAAQLASGLACAHRHGIVHRDLKPANVGFTDRDVAKILDFGIAVRATESVTAGSRGFAGTLAYVAPDVLIGNAPDARADVWALGVTLYEMLVGRRPFSGPTDSAVLYAILEHELPPFERVDGAPIPPDVEALVRLLLTRTPSLRPADGTEVLALLRALDPVGRSSATSADTTIGIGSSADAPSHSPNAPLPSAKHGTKDHAAAMPAAAVGQPARAPRRWAGVGIAALAVVSVAVAGVWLLRSGRSTDRADVRPLEVARTSDPLATIAVLPFTVRGGAELEYLRDGVVDLLTPAFDATGLLRGVDPNAVFGATQSTRGQALDSGAARTIASTLGASRFVTGSVVKAGAGFTLRATMYLATGQEAARAQVVNVGVGELVSAVDALVRQLVAAELRAPGDTMSAMAASTTTSARALRDYLDGERELRDARPAAAMVLYQRAVAEDPLFAVAWYRLARAAKWSEVDSLNLAATRTAFSLSGTLPLRSQALVRAYHAIRLGSPFDAERQLRQIVADYPTDVDAWMLLGEVLFEHSQYRGQPYDEALQAFRRVMTLDPRNREVNVYLMDLAARGDRLGELDTLFRMYFSPNSAGEQPGIRRTYIALHSRRLNVVRSALPSEQVIDDSRSAQIALRRVGPAADDFPAARQFAATLAAPTNDASMRVEGLLSLATVGLASQRVDEAAVAWRTAETIDRDATVLHRALMALSPTSRMSVDSLRALRSAVVQSASGSMRRVSAGDATTEQRMRDSPRESVCDYLAGMLSLRLRDPASVRQALERLSRRTTASGIAVALAQSLRGHELFAAGRFDDAVRAFDAGIIDVSDVVRAQSPVLQQYIDRFVRAQALDSLGRLADATRWYRSLRDGPTVWGAPFLAAWIAGDPSTRH